MKRLLLYTENYLPGGGNRFLIDFANVVPGDIEVTIASNIGGLFDEDVARLSRPTNRRELWIRSRQGTANRVAGGLSPESSARKWIERASFAATRMPVLGPAVLSQWARGNKRTLLRLLREGAYDAAIAFNGGYPAALSCLDLVIASHELGVSTALSIVSIPAPPSYADQRYSRVPEICTLAIANCEAIARDLVQTRRFRASKIALLRNKVGSPTASASSPGRLRQRTSNLVIGYVGRVEKSKGIHELLFAFSELRRSRSDLVLRLVGTVSKRSEILGRIKELGLGSAVQVMGYVNGSIYDELRNMDVFAFPSLWEGLPYSLLEAMSAGKPIVASSVGGIPEIIQDGRNGLLVQAGDSQGLCLALRRLVEDRILADALGAAARRTATEFFSDAKFASSVSGILSRLSPTP